MSVGIRSMIAVSLPKPYTDCSWLEDGLARMTGYPEARYESERYMVALEDVKGGCGSLDCWVWYICLTPLAAFGRQLVYEESWDRRCDEKEWCIWKSKKR